MAEDVLNGDWEPWKYDPVTGIETQIMDLGTHLAVRSVYRPAEDLWTQNAEMRVNEQNKGWGDGKVAASIPLNLLYHKFGEAMREGDQKWIARVLNDSDYSKLRTKEGKL